MVQSVRAPVRIRALWAGNGGFPAGKFDIWRSCAGARVVGRQSGVADVAELTCEASECARFTHVNATSKRQSNPTAAESALAKTVLTPATDTVRDDLPEDCGGRSRRRGDRHRNR